MEKDFVKMDLRTLLETYMTEAKEFSQALSNGASWDVLREKRMYIKLLSELINRKYKDQYNSERRRNMPPHGD
jgi:hypothetical protein